MTQRPLPSYLFFIIALILLCIGYSPIWNGEFIGDDIGRIELASTDLSLRDFLSFGLGDRPLLVFSIWLDRMYFKLSAGMMRLETLVMFAFFLILLRKIITVAAEKFRLTLNTEWRDIILLLFCLHPLHTQALTHIIQRGILLSTMGGMVCTYWILRDEGDIKKPRTQLAFVVWLLALLCKPNIAFLPIFWLTLLYLLKKLENWKTIGIFVLMLVVPVVYYKIGGLNSQTFSSSAKDYFLTQGEVIALYLRLAVIPIGLKFNHDYVAMPDTPLWPGVGWWILYGIVISICWRRLKPKISALFFVGGFFALIPESSIFPIVHASFEHRFFTPMCFFATAIALLPVQKVTKVGYAFAGILAAAWIFLIFQRMQETKSYVQWSARELTYSCRVEALVFYNFSHLAARGHIKEAKSALDHISRCNPKPHMFPLLKAYFEFFKEKKPNHDALKVIKSWTHSDVDMQPNTRYLFNSLILNHLQNSFKNEPVACYAEDFLSNQMRALNEDKHFFLKFIFEYPVAAKYCLKEINQKTDDESRFLSLKIRAIMHAYYQIKDPFLAEDLNKTPQEERYKRLRELFEKKK